MSKTFTIAGAGPVGSLLALYLAKKGHRVELYERRDDMRSANISAGKSINLALSDRGWKGLAGVGIADEIKKIAIPMYGRYIHNRDGSTAFQPYGTKEQAIYSVSRGTINKTLMSLAEEKGNAKIYFNEKCSSIDCKTGEVEFENTKTGERKKINSDFVIGADGAFSAIRLSMQLQTDRFEYRQHYIDCGYKELEIPAGKKGTHLIEKNALHIWPRNSFMLIALPNIDGSFTCTLFLPFEGEKSYANLKTPEQVEAFFKSEFPDALTIMPTLLDDFRSNPTSSLVTLKCFPWTYNNKVALIGDAAHAVVPFYGQGMNCGFEDCVVFNNLMEKHGNDWNTIFEQYQTLRKPDGDAIADLAIANFVEMRDKTSNKLFLLQKKIEARFSEKHPDKWIPLYTMVTYSPHLRYSYAMSEGFRQDGIMQKIMKMDDIEAKWDSEEVEKAILALL